MLEPLRSRPGSVSVNVHIHSLPYTCFVQNNVNVLYFVCQLGDNISVTIWPSWRLLADLNDLVRDMKEVLDGQP